MREGDVPGLSKVLVKKVKLLAKLKENMAIHKSEFEATHKVWRDKSIDALAKTLLAAKSGDEFSLHVANKFDLDEPKSYVESYEEVIEMLEFSEGDEVVLDRREFQQYVLDKWTWTETFKLSSSNYGGGR